MSLLDDVMAAKQAAEASFASQVSNGIPLSETQQAEVLIAQVNVIIAASAPPAPPAPPPPPAPEAAPAAEPVKDEGLPAQTDAAVDESNPNVTGETE